MHNKQDKAGSRLNDRNTGAILTNLGLNSVTSLGHIKWDFINIPGSIGCRRKPSHLHTGTELDHLNAHNRLTSQLTF